jgi:beta-glucosidase/6-phospho-beta-glucosidase/beta-galactosidase
MAHLDILGVNYYGVNQWEHTRPDSVLAEDDPRRKSLSELLIWLQQRFGAPMILSETTSTGDDRPRWLERAQAECLKAIRSGVDLQGFCIYPIVGMADWHTLEFLPMGLWDLHGPTRRRILHRPTADVLRRLQQPREIHERLAA